LSSDIQPFPGLLSVKNHLLLPYRHTLRHTWGVDTL
jgi:hypothetical protein